MKTRNSFPFLLLAALAVGATAAQAGEFHHHMHGDRDNGWQEGAAGVNGLPVHIRGIGTYVGGITATRIHGNGIYFSVAPGLKLIAEPPAVSRVKIINVSETRDNSACSMEHGVCVIRPGH